MMGVCVAGLAWLSRSSSCLAEAPVLCDRLWQHSVPFAKKTLWLEHAQLLPRTPHLCGLSQKDKQHADRLKWAPQTRREEMKGRLFPRREAFNEIMHHASEIPLLKCTLNSETEQLDQLPISHALASSAYISQIFCMTVKWSNIS